MHCIGGAIFERRAQYMYHAVYVCVYMGVYMYVSVALVKVYTCIRLCEPA